MASGLYFIVFICLTSGLWIGANAEYVDSDDDNWNTCPPGWTHFDQNCYMFHFSKKEWIDSEVACISVGGNLASIHTTDEYDFLKQMISRSTGSDIKTWVGGHYTNGVWLWSDGSKFDFKHWGKGEPNYGVRPTFCMELNFKGFPNDTNCEMKKSFLCKKPFLDKSCMGRSIVG